MDPQSNPINNTQGDDVPAGDTTLPSGGSTFQPQDNPAVGSAMPMGDTGAMGATPPPTPGWQNEAAADAAGVYGAPQPDQGASTMPPNPLLNDTNAADTAAATAAMSNDFNQASHMASPTAMPSPEPMQPTQPMADASSTMPPNPLMAENQPVSPASQEPVMPQGEPVAPMPQAEGPAAMPEQAMAPTAEPLPANDLGGSPPPDVPGAAPEMAQPAQNEVPMPQPEPSGAPAPILAPQPGTLPGSDQLGAAAAGMDQSAMQNSAMGAGMGTYGPPPKKSKKALFIIIGAVIGVIIISVVIAVLISSRRQPAQDINTSTQPTEQPAEVATPSSGPATPPEGYETIEKQCYTFALITPNTVPDDEACTFKRSNFGQKATSIIGVDTSTNAFKTVDEFDAKQIIYKFSDGKTYSYVAALITGKNYQQDGKAVTAIGITTSYQDTFSKDVTKNVLDTWRFK
jgi:hypothetical protein